MDPGDVVDITVCLRNTGNTTAYNVWAYISVTDPNLTLYLFGNRSWSASYNNIAPGTSAGPVSGGDASGKFRVTISSSMPPGSIVPVTLNISDSYGNSYPGVGFNLIINGPPVAPGSLNGVAQSPGSILWSWAFTHSNESGFSLRDQAGNTVANAAAGVTSCTESGLSPNTAYTRTVYAWNAYGGNQSAQATAYSGAAPPVSLILNGNLIEGCVALSWTGNGGTRYCIERALDSGGSAGIWAAVKSWADNVTSESYIDRGLNPSTIYWYRVKAYNGNGLINNTSSTAMSAVTMAGVPARTYKTVVYNNMVNPARNQSVQIRVDLPAPALLSVSILSFTGIEIAKLVNGENRSAGVNIIEWNGRNSDGNIVASGSYLAYIQAGTQTDKRKILVVK